MKKVIFFVSIVVFSLSAALFSNEKSTLSKRDKMLMQEALLARKKAYAPYSRYFVGAALLTKDGKIFHGTNVENASYGLTCCAERSAIFAAISQGYKDFVAIAVATKDGGLPCGGCRQVLNEFSPQIEVIICDEKMGSVDRKRLCDLLPSAFGPKNLSQ